MDEELQFDSALDALIFEFDRRGCETEAEGDHGDDLIAAARQERSALLEEVEKLRAEKADSDDFMAFMHHELAQRACACEDGGGDHSGTPPCCWPELIDCICKRAVQDAFKRDALDEAGA